MPLFHRQDQKKRAIEEMNPLKNRLNNVWQDESGQDLIEYALVAGLVGLSCVASLSSLASAIVSSFTGMGNTLTSNI